MMASNNTPDSSDNNFSAKQLHEAILARYKLEKEKLKREQQSLKEKKEDISLKEPILEEKKEGSQETNESLEKVGQDLLAALKAYKQSLNKLKNLALYECYPLAYLTIVQINQIQTIFPSKEYEWIFDAGKSISSKRQVAQRVVDSMVNSIEQTAKQEEIVKEEKQLYKEIMGLKKTLNAAKSKHQLKDKDINLHAAANRFDMNHILKNCQGLLWLPEEEFNVLADHFSAHKRVFDYYRQNYIHQAYLKRCEQAKEEFNEAFNKLDNYLSDTEKTEKTLFQQDLWTKGKNVLTAVNATKKDGTEKQYQLLTQIIIRTHAGLTAPTSVSNQKEYHKLTKKARGDLSVGRILWGALKTFYGVLMAGLAAVSLSWMVSFPPMVVPGVALGALGGFFIYDGISTIKNEIKQKRRDSLPHLGVTCTLFHRSMKEGPKPESKSESRSIFKRAFGIA